MEITCDIAKDLVDICTSGAASGNTQTAVREHLKTCKDCRSFYDSYKKSLEGGSDDDKIKRIEYETSPYLADEILSESIKKLSKRLRKRRAVSNAIGIATIVIGIVFAVTECLEAIKIKNK